MKIINESDGRIKDKTMLNTSGSRHEIAMKMTMLSSSNLIPLLILNRKSGSDSMKVFSIFMF